MREACREQSQPPWLPSVAADLRYALRQLRAHPGFAIVAVLTLAVGIGATTAVYSLADSILLHPLPFARQNALVAISGWYPKGWLRALAQNTHTLSGVMSYSIDLEHNVDGLHGPERIFASAVSTNAFAVLGVQPTLGRSFRDEEGVSGRDRVVLLSDGYWRQRFAADPHAVGRSIRVDGIARTIIGIMPAGLDFPDADTRMWLPVAFKPGDPIDPWAIFNGTMIGRLHPGATVQQAQAEMRALHPRLLRLFPWPMPERWNADVTAAPLLDALVKDARPRLLLLLGAVALLLVTACANVANLMMARGAARQGEFAVRSALGASSARLVRQMLTESLLLAVLGGAMGSVLAIAALPAIKAVMPPDLPRLSSVAVHPRALLVLVLLTLGTTLLFGTAPALELRERRLQKAMQTASARHSAGQERLRLARGLVIAQLALTMTAVATAALTLHSLWRLVHVDPGFQTRNIVTARLSLDSDRCEADAQKVKCAALYSAILTRLQQQPGVQAAALVSMLPLTGRDSGWAFDAEGHHRLPQQTPEQSANRAVSPGYFSLTGIRLERGRLLTEADSTGATRAVVISHEMAEHLWPGQDPIGKRLEVVGEETEQAHLDEKARSVVGVVASTHHASLDAPIGDEMYTPISPLMIHAGINVLLKTTEDPATAAATVRSVVASLGSVLDTSTASQRSIAILLSAFAILIATVGSVGMYSVMACIVAVRTREIGIRIAVGASRGSIASLVLGSGLRMAAAGGALGLLGSLSAARLMRAFLFVTSPLDPLSYAAVAVSLSGIALLSCALPSWRATRIEPIRTLRAE